MNRSVSLRSVVSLAMFALSVGTIAVGCAAEPTADDTADAEMALQSNDDALRRRMCTQPAMQGAFYWANEGLTNARALVHQGENYRACVQQAEQAISNIRIAVAIKEEKEQCDTPELWAAPSLDPKPSARAAVAFENAVKNLQQASRGREGYRRTAMEQLNYAIKLCAGRDI